MISSGVARIDHVVTKWYVVRGHRPAPLFAVA